LSTRKEHSPSSESTFDFLDRQVDYRDLLYQAKKLVMSTLFGAELRSLGNHMAMLASQDRYARDVPLLELTQALNETTACLGVYRTYIRTSSCLQKTKR